MLESLIFDFFIVFNFVLADMNSFIGFGYFGKKNEMNTLIENSLRF